MDAKSISGMTYEGKPERIERLKKLIKLGLKLDEKELQNTRLGLLLWSGQT